MFNERHLIQTLNGKDSIISVEEKDIVRYVSK